MGEFLAKPPPDLGTPTPIPYPMNLEPRVAAAGFPIGQNQHGWTRRIHPSATLIAGRGHAGKTTLLNSLIAGRACATDTLTWVIDLHQGLAPRWLYQHAAGTCPTPPIDWVALTLDTASTMVDAALDIIRARQMEHARRLVQPPPAGSATPDLIPDIQIIVDGLNLDTYRVYDTDQAGVLRWGIGQINRVGQHVGVTAVVSMRRATMQTFPDRDLWATPTLIGLGLEPVEAAYLFDGNLPTVDKPGPTRPGDGYLRPFGRTPQRFRGYLMTGPEIDRVSVETADRRPGLDHASMAAFPRYVDRWIAEDVTDLIGVLRGE